ncbi:MAG: hypothetical protein M3452_09620, partial [Chloroflexota bacterium]|nr:hypothetical protein [Chloroflexota bacterium]
MTDQRQAGAGRAGRAGTPGDDGQRERSRIEGRSMDRDMGEPLAAGERKGRAPRSRSLSPRPLSEWTSRPRILVTNDDGIESRGLLA